MNRDRVGQESRVNTGTSTVQIVVFEYATPGSQGISPGRAAARDALTTMGAELQIRSVDSADACRREAARSSVDLVVLDRVPPREWRSITDVTGQDGPPVIVLHEGSEDDAFEAFRAGVADCVRADAAGFEALPVVAMEQVRRYRPVRERRDDRRRWPSSPQSRARREQQSSFVANPGIDERVAQIGQ